MECTPDCDECRANRSLYARLSTLYSRYLGPHAQWRLDRARRKRFEGFCKERGLKRQMKIRKLYQPDTLKFKYELVIGWRSYSLTGFWFQ